MQKLVAGAVMLALMCGSATAFAQQLTFEDIPKRIEGSWSVAASGCALPALIVAPVEPYGFRFNFHAPVKRDEIMVERPPPPVAIVNGRSMDPVDVTFTPKAKPADTGGSKANPDINVEMPSPNVMVVKLRSNGQQVRYVRCAAAGIG
jgi:hypothetical protein